ncbi:hypothetical protein Cpir12675_000833 [Ceratocystis pirilliformis]|uniref:Uncharacterized protein n=1 Tax=Ceratocystis pirilliformis TaxID=259994 RepID=A0ABR3ZJY8_9PEZI
MSLATGPLLWSGNSTAIPTLTGAFPNITTTTTTMADTTTASPSWLYHPAAAVLHSSSSESPTSAVTTARVGTPLFFTHSPAASTAQARNTAPSSPTDAVVNWYGDLGVLSDISKMLLKRQTAPTTNPSIIAHTNECYPELQVSVESGLTETGFNSADEDLLVQLQCNDDYSIAFCLVIADGKIIDDVTCTANAVHAPNIFGSGHGDISHVSVAVGDSLQNIITNSWTFVFGSSGLSVAVSNADGSAASGARVELQSVTHPDARESMTAGDNGIAYFSNIPRHSIGITASLETAFAVNAIAGGKEATASLALGQPLLSSFQNSTKFPTDRNLTRYTSWVGDVHMLPSNSAHEQEPQKHQRMATVWTAEEIKTNVAQRVFAVPKSPIATPHTTAYVVYRFQSTESTAQDLNTSYNDFFHLSLHANDGTSQVQVHGLAGLGRSYFDQYGYAPWNTLQLTLPVDVTDVEATVAVSNIDDAGFQSQITIKHSGLCNDSAHCDDCPGLARCQNTCKNPTLDTCSFYWSCVSQTLNCTKGQTTLKSSAHICDHFQGTKHNLSAAAAQYFARAEQCVQKTLVPALEMQSGCQDASNLALVALPDCYVQDGLCDLHALDYTQILGLLSSHDHRTAFRQAIATAGSQCISKVLQTFGTSGSSPLDEKLSIIRGFFADIKPETDDPLPDVKSAVSYLEKVDKEITQFGSGNAQSLLDFLRWPTCNSYLSRQIIGDVPQKLTDFMKRADIKVYRSFMDGEQPMGISQLFCTVAGVYSNGPYTANSDLASWASVLFSAYSDWRQSTFSTSFAISAVGFLTKWNKAHASLVRGAIDGYVIAEQLKAGKAPNGAEAFGKALTDTVFAERVESFKTARFGGEDEAILRRCISLLAEDGDLQEPLVWAMRTQKLGNATIGDTAVVFGFCSDFAKTMGKL